MTLPTHRQIFLEKFNELVQSSQLVKLTLSRVRTRNAELINMFFSLVALAGGVRIQIVYRYKTRDITKNCVLDEASGLLMQALEDQFLNADLFGVHESMHLLTSSRGSSNLKTKKLAKSLACDLSHDREKERIVPPDRAFLQALGITHADGQVRKDMTDKYIQINRYIELIAPDLKTLSGTSELRIMDMGSGKGYLTFALYDYLSTQSELKLQITGVEYRADMVDLCNRLAVQQGFAGLRFVQGTIANTPLEQADVLIALHACDTATDEAIYRGIRGHAQFIVCAPCCHKQIRKALEVNPAMRGITKHGILEERQAEILTDGLRALILEAHGYKTKVFEFVTAEHTPKNLLITGRKAGVSATKREELLLQIKSIKDFYGIGEHHLERLLAGS